MPYIPGLGGIDDVYHSGNVFANFVNISLWNDPLGTDAVVIAAVNADINAPTFAVDEAINSLDGNEDPAVVDAAQQKLVQEGKITQAQLDAGSNAAPSSSDTSPGVVNTGTSTGAVSVSSSVDDTLLYDSPVTKIKYYVKTVTKQPGVVFPYDVATVAPQNGTTVQAVCNNLKALVVNCYDPIKAKYPDAFMTCSFRAKGVGSGTSQHPLGMACDIQYSSASKADYFVRAQWIKANLPYDQFILEYKTTGTGKPWHHISYNSAGNRGQVLTFMNDKNCKGPGVQGLYDLSGA